MAIIQTNAVLGCIRKKVVNQTGAQRIRVPKPSMNTSDYKRVNFYFNKTSGECEQFIYGGCEGNGNNFEKKPECEKACKPT
ncbi:Kunitz/Bovine pancreatic trypsin inhibitor domain protein [Ancylostoma duodenale]|uniref:Kunitz/Bovine pancreatic trypsin inhibitor domain protein n=1 Tax=Ancylostoma duodenale TaxID=51022 RepID=A0A0C2G6H9_9BILA|nr:Kunitz/Bovine pancreatic trypsin inhibitor domain protein [Ancylostoma duodenale]